MTADAPTTLTAKQHNPAAGRLFRFLTMGATAALPVSLYASGTALVLCILLGGLTALAAGLTALIPAARPQCPSSWRFGLAALLLITHAAIASRTARLLPLLVDNAIVVSPVPQAQE